MRRQIRRIHAVPISGPYASGDYAAANPADSCGSDFRTIRERLGHSNAAVTLGIYTHPLKADRDVAATVWDRERSGMLSDVINGTRKKLHVIEKKRA
jgi:integrase